MPLTIKVICSFGWSIGFHTIIYDSGNFVIEEVPGGVKCPTCPKVYKNRDVLRHHLKLYCGGKKPTFTCELCGKHFYQKSNWRVHQAVHLKNQSEQPFMSFWVGVLYLFFANHINYNNFTFFVTLFKKSILVSLPTYILRVIIFLYFV